MSLLTFWRYGFQSPLFDHLKYTHLINNVGISHAEDPRSEQQIEASQELYENNSIVAKYGSTSQTLITLNFTSYDGALKTWEQFRRYSINIGNVFGLASLALGGWISWKVFSNQSLQRPTNLMIAIGSVACAATATFAYKRAREIPVYLQTSRLAQTMGQSIIFLRRGTLRPSPPNFNPVGNFNWNNTRKSQCFTENEKIYFFNKIFAGNDKTIALYYFFPDFEVTLSTPQAELVRAFLEFRKLINFDDMKERVEELYAGFVEAQIEPHMKNFLDSSEYTNSLDQQLANSFNEYYHNEINENFYIPGDEEYNSTFLEVVCKNIEFKLKTGIDDAIEYINSEALNDFTSFLYLPYFGLQMNAVVKEMQKNEGNSIEWLSTQFSTIKDEKIKALLLECLKSLENDDGESGSSSSSNNSSFEESNENHPFVWRVPRTTLPNSERSDSGEEEENILTLIPPILEEVDN